MPMIDDAELVRQQARFIALLVDLLERWIDYAVGMDGGTSRDSKALIRETRDALRG